MRLLWRDRSARPLKPEVIEAELAHDYCAREGGVTLLGRRAAVDIHGNEDETAQAAFDTGLPPRSAMPFIVTLELLLLETDSPDQPLHGHQGRRNEPAQVAAVCACAAELRGVTPDLIAEATTANAERLFGLRAGTVASAAAARD